MDDHQSNLNVNTVQTLICRRDWCGGKETGRTKCCIYHMERIGGLVS